jgi:hypothetical protein
MKKKTKKQMQTDIPVQEVELLNQRFWTVRVPPDTVTVLGKFILSGTMVLKNYGPAKIRINNGRREDIELESGATRIIYVHQHLEVLAIGDNALVVFEYMPE